MCVCVCVCVCVCMCIGIGVGTTLCVCGWVERTKQCRQKRLSSIVLVNGRIYHRQACDVIGVFHIKHLLAVLVARVHHNANRSGMVHDQAIVVVPTA